MDPEKLALTLCTRLCHDLGGAVGTVAGALEMAESGDPEALTVALETAQTLRRQLRLYRAAFGGAVGPIGRQELLDLADGLAAGGRARLEPAGLSASVQVPESLAQFVLLGILVAGEALPRGGAIHIAGDADAGFALVPEGRNAAWTASLADNLAAPDRSAAVAAASGPREILAPLLVALAHSAGVRLSRALDPRDGPGLLVIGGAPALAA